MDFSKKNISDFYNEFWAGNKQEIEASLKSDLAVLLSQKSKVILDAGCGNGANISLIATLFPEKYVIGVDVSAQACKNVKCNLRNSNIDLIIADLAYMPLINCSFDFIVSSEVIEHVFMQDRKTVIRELQRLSKSSGYFLITTPNCIHPIILVRKILNILSNGRISLSDQPYDNPLSLRSLIKVLMKSGWSVHGVYFDKYISGTRVKMNLPANSLFAIQIMLITCSEK
jgi:SAM-dependent methyltransferase